MILLVGDGKFFPSSGGKNAKTCNHANPGRRQRSYRPRLHIQYADRRRVYGPSVRNSGGGFCPDHAPSTQLACFECRSTGNGWLHILSKTASKPGHSPFTDHPPSLSRRSDG